MGDVYRIELHVSAGKFKDVKQLLRERYDAGHPAGGVLLVVPACDKGRMQEIIQLVIESCSTIVIDRKQR